jgi:hypothetical protein
MSKKPMWFILLKAALLLALVAFLYYVFEGVIYFAAGGSVGGYGAPPERGEASWQMPVRLLLLGTCFLAAISIIRSAWRATRRDQKAD